MFSPRQALTFSKQSSLARMDRNLGSRSGTQEAKNASMPWSQVIYKERMGSYSFSILRPKNHLLTCVTGFRGQINKYNLISTIQKKMMLARVYRWSSSAINLTCAKIPVTLPMSVWSKLVKLANSHVIMAAWHILKPVPKKTPASSR